MKNTKKYLRSGSIACMLLITIGLQGAGAPPPPPGGAPTWKDGKMYVNGNLVQQPKQAPYRAPAQPAENPQGPVMRPKQPAGGINLMNSQSMIRKIDRAGQRQGLKPAERPSQKDNPNDPLKTITNLISTQEMLPIMDDMSVQELRKILNNLGVALVALEREEEEDLAKQIFFFLMNEKTRRKKEAIQAQAAQAARAARAPAAGAQPRPQVAPSGKAPVLRPGYGNFDPAAVRQGLKKTSGATAAPVDPRQPHGVSARPKSPGLRPVPVDPRQRPQMSPKPRPAAPAPAAAAIANSVPFNFASQKDADNFISYLELITQDIRPADKGRTINELVRSIQNGDHGRRINLDYDQETDAAILQSELFGLLS